MDKQGDLDEKSARRTGSSRVSRRIAALAAVAGFAAGAFQFYMQLHPRPRVTASSDASAAEKPHSEDFRLKPHQLAGLTIEPVAAASFRARVSTDGKIAVDEDVVTPVFSPYAGRILKLLVKPGDTVTQGQPLFVVEATDMVQALNDYVSALTALNKAKSQVRLADAAFSRATDLYKEKAYSLKDFQQAEANNVGARSDQQAAETALEAARNRLRILGKTEAEIRSLDTTGKITADTVIPAPISGSVVQRKVGLGQYVTSGATDPVFVIGDLGTVWLIANIREGDAQHVRVGQEVSFTILADEERSFSGKVSYLAPTVDATTRRLQVRADIDNHEGYLRPEMFASVDIFTKNEERFPAVPRNAVIYEGTTAHVWLVAEDGSIRRRAVKTGQASGALVQVVEGLRVGEKIVTKGALFVDRVNTQGDPG